jgi:hypothetical protein
MRGWQGAVLFLLGMTVTADHPTAFVVAVLATLVAAYVVAGMPLMSRRAAHGIATSLRCRARDAGVPLLCDPDAPGRVRPRAPSV